MFKKLLAAVVLLSGLTISANAQQYNLLASTIDSTTTGTTPTTPPNPPNVVLVYNIATNVTASDSIQLTWKVIFNSIPIGWVNSGICDNINCFGSAATLSGAEEHITKKFGHNQQCGFIAEISAPTNAQDGIATVQIRTETKVVNGDTITNGQVDTLTFILRKVSPTGIAVIKGNDNRVTISPNPTNNNLIVFADKALNASKITIVSIAGQVAFTTAVTGENSNINVSSLAKGTYIVNVADNKGQIITARKFIKD